MMSLQILVEVVSVWFFYVKLLSRITPENLVTLSGTRTIPSMNSSGNNLGMKRSIELGYKIVHLVLLVLIESLLALE